LRRERTAVGANRQARREQGDDRGRARRDERGLEQPVWRVDVEIVRDIEVVGDERSFDRIALELQVEIRERNRMGLNRSRCGKQQSRRTEHTNTSQSGASHGGQW
jgi:hypothetical protein